MTLSNMYGPPRPLIDADYHRIGHHLLQPFDAARVQPASYDVTLGPKLLRPREPRPQGLLDLRSVRPAELMEEDEVRDGYILRPNQCALVSTNELVSCPADMLCSVDGKSTLGRCFLAVHATAGFIDPGYIGVITLELTNHGPWDFVLYEGMPIAQLRFVWLGVLVDAPYGSPGLGSHYQLNTRVAAAAGGP
jgi:dCTP deaminase